VAPDGEVFNIAHDELTGLMEREGVAGGWLSKKWSDAMFKKHRV